MPRALIKSRLHSNKRKPENKPELNSTKSKSPQNLQLFEQKLLSQYCFC